MRKLHLAGAIRCKHRRTTVSGDVGGRSGDLVDWNFTAPAPNRLWVADLTYINSWTGFVYRRVRGRCRGGSLRRRPADARLRQGAPVSAIDVDESGVTVGLT